MPQGNIAAKRQSMSLPHTIEGELAVIGGILLEPQKLLEHIENLKPEYFYVPFHKKVVEIILELAAQGHPPDTILINEALRKKDPTYTEELYNRLQNFPHFADVANLGYWLQELKKYWELRLIIEKCSDIVHRGKQLAADSIDPFLQEVEATFLQIAENRITTGLKPASDVCLETMRALEQIIEHPGDITGIPSGFTDLDAITSGFQPSDLIILAARPAMGKTSLALNIAAYAAIEAEKQVAVFSLEMSSQQLMQRMLSTMAHVHAHKFRNGRISTDEFERLYDTVREFQTDRLMLDDTPGISVLELASRCRKMKREKGRCDLIIVDYLQLMSAGPAFATGKSSREREISYISMSLKGLAKELQCPVIALSQLNRGLEQRPDKRPRPSDLRESGSIEQDADLIMFIYRDEVYHPDSPEKGIAEIIIAKNRHGPTTTVKLAFLAEFTQFANLAHGYT